MGVAAANEERHLQLNTTGTPMLLGALRHVYPLDRVLSGHYLVPRFWYRFTRAILLQLRGLRMFLSKLLVICYMLRTIERQIRASNATYVTLQQQFSRIVQL